VRVNGHQLEASANGWPLQGGRPARWFTYALEGGSRRDRLLRL